MGTAEFIAENRINWDATLNKIFPRGIPTSAKFTSIDDIVKTLGPICKLNLNHTMLPDRGGNDIVGINLSLEEGCIDLRTNGGATYRCKPATLLFEHFPQSAWNSFFLLETAQLKPSGVYEELTFPSEELVELPDGAFLERFYWDQGFRGHDESGAEIPFPKDTRLLVRYFSGKFLFVAKGSLWNEDSGTYDGRHSKMTAEQVRNAIFHAIQMYRQ